MTAIHALPDLAATTAFDTAPPAAAGTPHRVAAIGMALAAVLSIVFVGLDPEIRAHGAGPVLQAIAAAAPMHRLVHVAESLFVLLLAHGVTSLGTRLGVARPLVRLGVLAYVLGALAMLAAATFDGFVTPAAASAWLAPNHDAQAGLEAVRFAGIAVQSFATMSWGLESVGALALSAAMAAGRGGQRRLGVLGLAAALAPLVALAVSGPVMDMTVVIGILLAQAAWNLTCAAALWRRERP